MCVRKRNVQKDLFVHANLSLTREQSKSTHTKPSLALSFIRNIHDILKQHQTHRVKCIALILHVDVVCKRRVDFLPHKLFQLLQRLGAELGRVDDETLR